MTKAEVDDLDSLDGLLDALNSLPCDGSGAGAFYASIIEPNGVAHGWVTITRNMNLDGSENLWFGLRQEGDHFCFDISDNQFFDFFDGDQRMFSFQTLEEVKAFMRGILWTLSTG